MYLNKIGQFVKKPFNLAGMAFKRLSLRRKVYLVLMGLLALIPVGDKAYQTIKPYELVYNRVALAEAAELELPKNLTLEQAKKELDDIVWGIEGGHRMVKEGEIAPTFDPCTSDSKWCLNSPINYYKCIKVGGWMHRDCLSYGPRQIKIGTIINYWPQMHDGAPITEKDARDVAESNEGSYQFFMDCSIKIEGCVWNWTAALNNKAEVSRLIRIIRAGEGITL